MSILIKVGNLVQRRLKKELLRKRTFESGSNPMNTTGSLSESLTTKIKPGAEFDTLTIEGLHYGKKLDDGYTTPIEFAPKGQGHGGKSPYILGLQKWLINKKGYDAKLALKTAFAIAKSSYKQKSPDPAVRGWIKNVKDDIDKDVLSFVTNETTIKVQQRINAVLNITIP